MELWAVSYIAWSDNELTTEFVRANNFHDAIFLHSKVAKDLDPAWQADLMKFNPENVKQAFFDCDSMIEAVPVPPRPAYQGISASLILFLFHAML